MDTAASRWLADNLSDVLVAVARANAALEQATVAGSGTPTSQEGSRNG